MREERIEVCILQLRRSKASAQIVATSQPGGRKMMAWCWFENLTFLGVGLKIRLSWVKSEMLMHIESKETLKKESDLYSL